MSMGCLFLGWMILLGDEPTPIGLVELAQPTSLVFDKDIYPVFENKCITCHDREGGLAEGDLDLTTVAGILQGGKHGAGLVAGQGEMSLVFRRSGHRLAPVMPPEGEGDPLTPEELTKLKLWIDQGAPTGDQLHPAQNRPREIAWETPPAGVQPVLALALSPDGTKLARSSGLSAEVLDSATGERIVALVGGRDWVQSLAWSPDGKRLAVGSHGQVQLWEVAGAGTWPDPKTLGPITERALGLAFSPDGSRLAVGGGSPSASGEITIWSTTDGQQVARWSEPHSDLVTGLAYSSDGAMLASCSADKFVKIWNSADGALMKSLEGHTGGVLGIAWSADNKQLASVGSDSALKLWNVEAGEQAISMNDHRLEVTSVRFVPGQRQIVTTAGDRVVRIWNADDGKLLRACSGAGDYLLCEVISPDGATVWAGSQTGEIHAWKLENGELTRTIPAATR
jgi:WD40 repeat protein